jgi:TolB-like protein
MSTKLTCVVIAAMTAFLPTARAEDNAPRVYPTALFPFEERGTGAKEYGAKVSDIVFATLAARPKLYLVDRSEMKKTLEEQQVNLSGVVNPAEATQVGQLTGAKILVTGSVVQVDKSLYLVAKIIGTETSRVVGASVKGKSSDDLAPLAEQLAEKIGESIEKEAENLVAKRVAKVDRIAALKSKVQKGGRPTLAIRIPERHVGQSTIDPAAQTEFSIFAKETGFELIDPDEGSAARADVLIKGEGFSEFAGRVGNLISVKARVEIKAIDRKSEKVIAIDRQTVVIVDLAEQVAGKSALQEAAATIAERMLPKLVKE